MKPKGRRYVIVQRRDGSFGKAFGWGCGLTLGYLVALAGIGALILLLALAFSGAHWLSR